VPATTKHTAEQVRSMLAADAIVNGLNTHRAAVNLLLFTDIPDTAVIQQHLEIYKGRDVEGNVLTAARVADWTALMDGLGRHLTGGQEALLTLAAALDTRKPVDLVDVLPRAGGFAYAKAMIEAVKTATGYDEWYTITPGSGMIAHQEFEASLGIGGAS
jgi:hypothetical protein